MNWEMIISNRFYNHKIEYGRYLGIISMVGMGIGCFAIVVAISVMNGFETYVHKKLKGFDGDIRVYDNNIENIFNKLNGISSIMPFMERKAVLEGKDSKRIVSLKAVDQNTLPSFYKINLRGLYPKSGEIIIGQDIAYRLGKEIGDKMIVFSPIDQNIGLTIPYKKQLKISGIFSTKILDYDDKYAFITLTDGKKIFKKKNVIDGYDLRINDKYIIENVKNDISTLISKKISVLTWEDQNQSLVNAMRMERYGTIVVLCLIFLVAAFNLSANLTLIFMQKIRDIGILKVLGSSEYSIYKIIIQLGLMRAGKGSIVGFLLGVLIIIVQEKMKLIPIPSEVYFIDSLPMQIYFTDVILIVFISSFFILIASFYSARTVIKLDLKEAIQWAK